MVGVESVKLENECDLNIICLEFVPNNHCHYLLAGLTNNCYLPFDIITKLTHQNSNPHTSIQTIHEKKKENFFNDKKMTNAKRNFRLDFFFSSCCAVAALWEMRAIFKHFSTSNNHPRINEMKTEQKHINYKIHMCSRRRVNSSS